MKTLYGRACKKEVTTEKGAITYKLQNEEKTVYFISFGNLGLNVGDYIYFRNRVFQVANTNCKVFGKGTFAYAI